MMERDGVMEVLKAAVGKTVQIKGGNFVVAPGEDHITSQDEFIRKAAWDTPYLFSLSAIYGRNGIIPQQIGDILRHDHRIAPVELRHLVS